MTGAAKTLVEGGHKALLHPRFSAMSDQDRLLRVAMMAYAKFHMDSQHLLDSDVTDALYCEICNTIGDDAFIAWGEKIREEANTPDL